MSVGELDIDFFQRIRANDLLVKDQENDTLFYIKKFVAKIDSFDLETKYVRFKQVSLQQFNFGVKRYADSSYNFQFLLDSLSGDKERIKLEQSAPSNTKWHVKVDAVEWERGTLSYTDRVKVAVAKRFAPRRSFKADKFKGELLCRQLAGDSVNVELKRLSLIEKNGLDLQSLKGEFIYSQQGISLNKFYLKTPRSKLAVSTLSLYGDSLFTSRSQLGNAKVAAAINKSYISLLDLKSVIPSITHTKQQLSFYGMMSGTIGNLNIKEINLHSGDIIDSKISGMLNGLPNWESTFMYINTPLTYVNFKNLSQFLNEVGLDLKLKEQTLNKLEYLNFNGNLTGYPDNLVAYGKFNTGLGDLSSDLAIETYNNLDSVNYKGKLSSGNLELGALLNAQEKMGKIAFNVSMNGYKLKEKPLAAIFEGTVDTFEYKNYLYQNIDINAFVSDRIFNGNLNVKDPNGILKFNGKVDMSTAIPEFDFDAYVYKFAPEKMHLLADFPANVSCEINANFRGNSIDNLNGEAIVKALEFESKSQEYNIDSIKVLAFADNGEPNIRIESEIVNGSLRGSYAFASLARRYPVYLKNAIPTLTSLKSVPEAATYNNFNFQLKVNEYAELGEMLHLPLIIYDDAEVHGVVNENDSVFDISASVLKMKVKQFDVENLQLRVENSHAQNDVNSYVRCAWFGNGNKGLSNILLKLNAASDSLNYLLSWANAGEKTNSGHFQGIAGFKLPGVDSLQVSLQTKPSYLIINDSIWDMPKFEVAWQKGEVNIDSLLIQHQKEYLLVDGVLGKQNSDTIRVKTDGVDLSYVTDFFKSRRLTLGGVLSGNAVVLNALDRPIAMANFNVDSLWVNEQFQGDLDLKSTWDERGKLLALRTLLKTKDRQPLSVSGIYNPTLNTVNLSMDMNKFRLDFLQPYLNSAIQNIRGVTSGHLDLKGEVTSPYLEGYVYAQNIYGDIDYLKTTYSFSDTVYFDKNSIRFNDVTLRDYAGNRGTLRGAISHTGFRNMSYDLTVNVENFNLLDTSPKDNELFYGKAFGTGSLYVSGFSKQILLDAKVRSEEGTKIYIPLSDEESAGEYSFIQFYNYGENRLGDDQKNEQPSGVAVNLDLEATPDAEVQLIFNSKMGDIIRGYGAGDLNFSYGFDRDFKMFGEYEVLSGTYSFILRNVINKKFDISEGGLVTWSGDPYGAIIDLDAFYRTKASLYELMGDALSEEKRSSRVPVNCHMMLSGNLMSPGVKFDIELPTSNEETQSRVDNIINSEEEMSRQVISLLVLNSFYTPDQLRATGGTEQSNQSNAAWVTTSELLSNQLSHWLSQISQSFDVGFNYRPGTEITSDEVEVALSTQIFDNRVKINGNLGYRQEQQYTSNFVGDFDVDFRLNKSGTVLLKAYTHANDDILNETSPTTQGVGVIYREDFDKTNDLIEKYKRIIRSIFRRKTKD